MTAVYPAGMLLLALACSGPDKTLDAETTSTEHTGADGEACPPWAGLELGTELTWSTTSEYVGSSGTSMTKTRTVVSHEDWEQGGTLVRTEGSFVSVEFRGDRRTSTSTETYGCNDDGAFLLTRAVESAFISNGTTTQHRYEAVFEEYRVMSWTPEDGWYSEFDQTITNASGSFWDPGDFEVVFTGEGERTTPAGTFATLGLSFNGFLHHYSAGVGLVETSTLWLVSQ